MPGSLTIRSGRALVNRLILGSALAATAALAYTPFYCIPRIHNELLLEERVKEVHKDIDTRYYSGAWEGIRELSGKRYFLNGRVESSIDELKDKMYTEEKFEFHSRVEGNRYTSALETLRVMRERYQIPPEDLEYFEEELERVHPDMLIEKAKDAIASSKTDLYRDARREYENLGEVPESFAQDMFDDYAQTFLSAEGGGKLEMLGELKSYVKRNEDLQIDPEVGRSLSRSAVDFVTGSSFVKGYHSGMLEMYGKRVDTVVDNIVSLTEGVDPSFTEAATDRLLSVISDYCLDRTEEFATSCLNTVESAYKMQDRDLTLPLLDIQITMAEKTTDHPDGGNLATKALLSANTLPQHQRSRFQARIADAYVLHAPEVQEDRGVLWLHTARDIYATNGDHSGVTKVDQLLESMARDEADE